MYEAYFGVREKPFSILPDPNLIYWGEAHRLAFAMLELSVMNAAGFTVITGEIGSGKTTLIRHLLQKLAPTVNVGLITYTRRRDDDLLPWIMMALGQNFENLSYVSLYQRFQSFLVSEFANQRRTVIIIDEAQNLSADALEGLRMLSNLNTDKNQLMQLILVGQPELKDQLQKPELAQFAQRVSCDFHLVSLNTQEVTEYIAYRLMAAGRAAPLFSTEACNMIAKSSCGIPRSINILCDMAMIFAYAASIPTISGEIVKAVLHNKGKYGLFPPGIGPQETRTS